MPSDAAERKQESLGLPSRGEAFHHPFADPGRLMGVLGPVELLPAAMGHPRQKLAASDLIAGQLVSDNHPRHLSQALEQLTEKPLGRRRVAARLHQNVEHVAVPVDRAPQVMAVPLIVTNTSSKCHIVAGAGPPPT